MLLLSLGVELTLRSSGLSQTFPPVKAFLFSKCLFILKVRIAEIERHASLRRPQQPGLGQAKAGAGGFIWISHTTAEAEHVGHLLLVFPAALAGSWLGRGAAWTETSVHMGCRHHIKWLKLRHRNAAQPLCPFQAFMV